MNSINQSINIFIVYQKVDQTAGQLSLPLEKYISWCCHMCLGGM